MRIETHNSITDVPPVWDSLAPRARVGLESRHLAAIERSGINAIEPYYLVVKEGDEVVGIAYCFLMQMDFGFLQKDLPAETVRTLRAWHPGFMRSRLLECGFVSGLGEGIAAREGRHADVCQAAAREMERIARDAGAEVALIRDVPASQQTAYAGLTEQGFQSLLGFPIARMAVRWPSFEAYLEALKCTSRKRIRRYLSRRSPDLGSEIIQDFGPLADRLAQLWANTHRRATDYSHEELTPAYFREIDRQLGDRSHVVAIRRRGEIVAFSLCLLGDEEYFSAHAGFDYDQAGDDNLYFCLSMAVLDDALPRGLKTINRGITTYDVKFELGFEADPQLYLVKHVKEPRLTVAIARRLREAMPQPVNDHRPFRDQDLSERPRAEVGIAPAKGPASGPDLFDKVQKHALYERANDARLAGLYTFFPPFESAQGPVILRDGRSVVMLGSNAYLGLGTHPEVVAAAKAATAKYGTGCSGSPFLNGTLDIHVDLARSLADFMGKEDAIICSTGYQTNLGVVAALAGEGDVLIMDRLDHASLVDGARLSHAEVARFRHNDVSSLQRALEQYPDRPKFVIVDSVFSMEGTIADLPAIVRLAKAHGARVMVDEAHAIGVLGPGGRGACELLGVLDQVDVVMGTFSKSFASVGGFVAGAAGVIDYLRHATRSHMFSASLPPASVAATRAALEIIKREPQRRTRVLANARYMAQRLQEQGYDAPYRGTAIVPVHCGQELLAFGLYKKLLDEGVFVNPVASPAVVKGRELLRTSYMATHDQQMLDRAAAVFARVRTDSFPRQPQLRVVSRPGSAMRVRPMVFLPVADRRSLPRYYVAGSPHGLVRIPGFTRLEIGHPVDCGISFGKEGLIVQSQGRVVAKCLIPRPGRALGIDVELLPTEGRTRDLLERFVQGKPVEFAGRHGWRYHADIDLELPVEEAAQDETIEDISLEGAAIHSHRRPALGSRLPLRLRTPGGDAIDLEGEVRWHRDGDEPAFGVRFDLSNPQQRARMRELIDAITSSMADCADAARVA